ncbi:Uncharacterised protein [Mycobacterium tuberculosis]|nr:Uncharacterised protein [Mycobacterium tuberculosis]
MTSAAMAGLGCCLGCRPTASSRWAPRTIRPNSTWHTWACGWRSGPTASRCCMAGSVVPCSTSCGRDSTPMRCRSAPSPTVCTRPPGRRRSGCSWAASWPGRTLCASPSFGSDCIRSILLICGGSAHNCGRCWWRTSGRGCGNHGWNVVQRMPNWVGSRRHSIRMCSPSASPGGSRPTSG